MFAQSIAVLSKEKVIKSSNSHRDVACRAGRPERYKLWTESQMSSTCELVRRGEMSTRRAAESFMLILVSSDTAVTGNRIDQHAAHGRGRETGSGRSRGTGHSTGCVRGHTKHERSCSAGSNSVEQHCERKRFPHQSQRSEFNLVCIPTYSS